MNRKCQLSIVVATMLTFIAVRSVGGAGIVESFNGDGEFMDASGRVSGFDLSDWLVHSSDWELSGTKVLDGTFAFDVSDQPGFEGQLESMVLRDINWHTSFVQRIEIQGLSIDRGDLGNEAALQFLHNFDSNELRSDNLLGFTLFDGTRGPTFVTHFANKEAIHRDVELGSNVAFEIVYHDEPSLVEFRYDPDISDKEPSIEIWNEIFPNVVKGNRVIEISANALGDGSKLRANVDQLSLRSPLPGDFNYDESLDVLDLAILAGDIGTSDPRRDINRDLVVDSLDVDRWVHHIAFTYYGDANLDGEFNSTDLVTVFGAAEYEDSIVGNSTWNTGDWNLDGDFTSGDLVLAFQDAGYEQGPRVLAAVVPEPTLQLTTALLAVLVLLTPLRANNRLAGLSQIGKSR
ncbi:hypothetical protein ACFL2H_06410 [Planctomycetota bacterium]